MYDITELKQAEQALRRIEESLRKSKDELEQRVRQRTADLEQVNKRLRAEIRTRKQAQTELIVYQNQLRSLASELSLAEERTRRQIATDVHDRIGQNLAIAKMKLQHLSETVKGPQIKPTIDEIKEIIADAIESTRTLTFEISPPVLYELGFEAAIEWLLRKARKQQHLKTDFQTDGQKKPLDENISVFLFQAVRELLINVAKHAKARNVVVSVCRLDDHIQVSVTDDGIGFDKNKLESVHPNPSGFGLFSIRERLSYIGGKLHIESQPGKGAEFTITAPLA
jgi:signal transduction histidine kinase